MLALGSNREDRSAPLLVYILEHVPHTGELGWVYAKALDLLVLGEDVVASMGLKPRRLGLEVVVLSGLAVGACVSVCGAIGFVGLIAPVIARRLVRGHPGRALLPSAAIGGALVLAADLASRSIPLDRSIPVGVLTTLAGTPVFLAVLVSMRRRLTS